MTTLTQDTPATETYRGHKIDWCEMRRAYKITRPGGGTIEGIYGPISRVHTCIDRDLDPTPAAEGWTVEGHHYHLLGPDLLASIREHLEGLNQLVTNRQIGNAAGHAVLKISAQAKHTSPPAVEIKITGVGMRLAHDRGQIDYPQRQTYLRIPVRKADLANWPADEIVLWTHPNPTATVNGVNPIA